MQALPRGYYAVIPMPRGEYDLQADSFTYKGVTYAGRVGENLFPTVAAALEKATEAPDTVLEGLSYDGFSMPVILLGPGIHHIAHKSYAEQVVIERSVAILGAKAGVDPNCKGSYRSHSSFKSYDLWVELLQMGKHVYTSAGSDTHGAVTNECPSTFYTQRRFHTEFLDRMRAGDFAVGGVGVQMMIDAHPLGSQIAYREGMTLTLRVGDFHAATWHKDTVYELQVWTDEGLAYASRFDGSAPQALALAVQKRRFYRVVVEDITHGYRVCVGNPIWLDKDADEN